MVRAHLPILYRDSYLFSGNVEDKTASQLYQLKDEFTKLPAQAIECALAGCTITSTE